MEKLCFFGDYLKCSTLDLNQGFHKISRNSLEFLQGKHCLSFDDEVALFKTLANTHKFILGMENSRILRDPQKNGSKIQGTC